MQDVRQLTVEIEAKYKKKFNCAWALLVYRQKK